MVRVGIVGTSAWTENMYVKNLRDHPDGEITAVCARDYERTKAFAAKWQIPQFYTDWHDMLDSDEIDAVIIATPHNTHYPIAMHALKNNLHVLCEKPLAVTYAQADAIATEAERRGVIHMTALTYMFFPHYRYLAHQIKQGEIGTPFHINMRFYSMIGWSGEPKWRFDERYGGAGALADLGPHVISVVRMCLGRIRAVSAWLSTHVTREDIPERFRTNDHAMMMVRFENGAEGVLHISTVSVQPPAGGHRQVLEVSGSKGTYYFHNDFSREFSLKLAKPGMDEPEAVHIPDAFWDAAISRDNPRAMYGDLFGKSNAMGRGFISAIAEGRNIEGPNLREGAEIQHVMDAALESWECGGSWVDIR